MRLKGKLNLLKSIVMPVSSEYLLVEKLIYVLP
jgi:hypothetical protein